MLCWQLTSPEYGTLENYKNADNYDRMNYRNESFTRHSRKCDATDYLYDRRRFDLRLLFFVIGFLHPRSIGQPQFAT